jgi:hypothetical protein
MKKPLLRRILRGFLFLLAFLATAIVLWYSITSFLGRREWAAAKKVLEARGEKLSLADMVPPPLADDLNFAAAPAFTELFDYKLEYKHVETKTGKAIFPSTEYRVPPDKQQFAIVKNTLATVSHKVPRKANELPDLAASAATYRAEKHASEDNRPPGEVVLEALAPAKPLMDEIARYAERPGARFPVRYEDGISAAIPHVSSLLTMAKYLNLRASASMELGRGADAASDLLLILRMADAIKSEPALIAILVRFSMLNFAIQTIWEGLARGVWDDAQLAALQDRLRGYDLYVETANSLRGERAIMLSFMESALGKGGFGKFLSSITEISPEGPKVKDTFGARLVTTVYPKGWAYSDLAFMAGVHQRWIDSLENRQGPLRPDDFDFLDEEMGRWSFPGKIRHIFSALTLPAINSVVTKAAAVQTGLDETRSALALERYRLVRGDLPETLEALVPEFLAAVPNDVMTGQPLSYRRLSSDNFLLWSVGWDTVDDSGKALDPKTKKGDIVWRRLPESVKSR